MARPAAARMAVGFVATIAILVATPVGADPAAADPAAADSDGSPLWPVCDVWRPVVVPGGGFGSVTDVAVVSSTDAWAISDHGYESWNESHVYRWAGLHWSEVRFPIRPSPDRFWVLTAIEAVTATEIWVVGYEFLGPYRSRAISARWDGARWTVVPVGLVARGLTLDGLAVTPGTHRLWAVGALSPAGDTSTQVPFVLRWSGQAWRRVGAPSPGRASAFTDIVTVGTSTWAVGYVRRGSQAAHVLASRWSGDGWTVRSGPVGRLVAVDGIAADEIWGVGTTPERSGYERGLIVRWDGARWSLARRFDRASELRDIVVTSGSDAWAVGRQGRNARPFVVRRHGGPWAASARPGAAGWLTAIGGTPHNLWTFRTHFPGGEPSEVVAFDTYHRC